MGAHGAREGSLRDQSQGAHMSSWSYVHMGHAQKHILHSLSWVLVMSDELNQPTACYYMLEPHTVRIPSTRALRPSASVDALHQCARVTDEHTDLLLRLQGRNATFPTEEEQVPSGLAGGDARHDDAVEMAPGETTVPRPALAGQSSRSSCERGPKFC